MNELLNVPSGRPLPLEMHAWLGGLAERQRSELEQTWRLAGLAEPSISSPDLTAAWAQVRDAIAAESRSELVRTVTDRAPARKSRTRLMYVALPLLSILVAGAVLLYWLRPVTANTPAGEVRIVNLPDGSTVQLNSLSSLSYRRRFLGENRAVSLRGEAFFDVVEGEEPFTIETQNAEVTVLGTRFNVRAHPFEGVPVTAVVLESGSVQLVSKHQARSVLLQPGQQSVVFGLNAPTTAAPVDVSTTLAWLTGGLAFFNQPVGTILDEVERRYGVEIAAQEDVRQDTISISLPRPQSSEAVLADICAFLDCTYRQSGAAYVIER